MKQPELGRKIAALRKEKGLTQEELVETCNLSVRTLQRIESGEVTPRSYTIKVIFSALDYSFTELIIPEKDKSGIRRTNFSIRLEQFYLYVVDLFNLKTNTMRKVSILSVTFILIVSGLVFFNTEGNGQSFDKVKKTIEDRNAAFITDFNSGNLSALMDFYTGNACLLPGNCCERSCILQHWTMEYAKGYKITDITILSLNVSDEMAVEKGKWKIAWSSGAEMSGMYLIEWHYIDKQWKKLNDMSGVDIVYSAPSNASNQ
jgi:transcriptional regulator with XRE-family HTH domain